MAHAPSAPDLDLDRLVVALDGAADRPAEREAARPRGKRVLHDIDRKRITGHGQASGWPHMRLSGTVRPWSTPILLTMVRSKSCWMTDWAIWAASSGWPITFGTGRGPHPSSAGVYSAAVPMAKVGIRSRLKAVAWSLKTRKMTSGLLSLNHAFENS